MLLGGLWHGAGWTFVVWGGLHGVGLALERWRRDRPGYVAPRGHAPRRIDRAPDHVPPRLPGLGVLPGRLLRDRQGPARPASSPAGARPRRSSRAASLLAIVVGIGSQYLPARFPTRVMERFSRLPVVGQAAVLGRRAHAHEHHGPRRRRTLHLLPLLMSSRNPPELPKLPPIRESAEQVLPPAPEEAVAYDETPPPAATAAAAAPERPVRRRAGRRPRPEDGRRALTAGHALVVALLALALRLPPQRAGDAQVGLQPASRLRSATLRSRSPGPLADVSHALLLDRPRKLLQDALGREDEDKIDITISFPPTTASTTADDDPGPTPVAKPARPRRSRPRARVQPEAQAPDLGRRRLARDHARVGDLRAAGGRAPRSCRRWEARRPRRHRPRAARRLQLVHDIATQVGSCKPNAIVLDFGGNDDHGYMTGLPEGVSIGDFGSAVLDGRVPPPRRRVLDSVNRAGGDRRLDRAADHARRGQTQRFDTINAIVAAEARKRAGARRFIDTYAMFASDNGGFAQYLDRRVGIRRAGARRRPLRAPRAATSSRGGASRLNQQFDLTSWRQTEGRVTRYVASPARGQRRWTEQPPDAGPARGSRRGWARRRVDRAPERQRRLPVGQDGGRGREARPRHDRGRLRPRHASPRALREGARRDCREEPVPRRPRDARPEDAPRRVPREGADEGRDGGPRSRPVAARRVRRARARGVPQLPQRLRSLEADARLPREVLRVEGTARNWRTVLRLAELLEG